MRWKLFFDGSCEPVNPGGHATYGWCLFSPDGKLFAEDCGHIGSGEGMTNNVAEFAALEAALDFVVREGVEGPLDVFGDSQLVVNLVSGRWVCRKPHLRIRLDHVMTQLKAFDGDWTIRWVPRNENSDADCLSREAVPDWETPLPARLAPVSKRRTPKRKPRQQ